MILLTPETETGDENPSLIQQTKSYTSETVTADEIPDLH